MNPTEEEIRLTLGELRGQEISEYASEHPEFVERIERGRQVYISHVNKVVSKQLSKARDVLDPEEYGKFETLVSSLVLPVVSDVSDKMTYGSIKRLSEKQYEENLNGSKLLDRMFHKNKLDGIDFSDILNLEEDVELTGKMVEALIVPEILVGAIKQNFRKVGAKALERESIYQAWRDVMPEKEDKTRSEVIAGAFKKHKRIANTRKIFRMVEKDPQKAAVKAETFDKTVQAFYDGLNKFYQTIAPAHNDMCRHVNDKIYGKKE
ncbi:MAG: hypothetical protein V1818_01780 [Candidatus Aenigmatarchaeota archaeon]